MITTFFALTLFTNLGCTLLIAGRIWWGNREAYPYVDQGENNNARCSSHYRVWCNLPGHAHASVGNICMFELCPILLHRCCTLRFFHNLGCSRLDTIVVFTIVSTGLLCHWNRVFDDHHPHRARSQLEPG